MVLTDEDKARVRACWAPVSKNAKVYGAKTLTRVWEAKVTKDEAKWKPSRLYSVYPIAKPYFHHFDLSPDSSDLKAHGKKVMDAITEAINNLDDVALSKLIDLHAQKLHVDPVNFKLLNHSLDITIAAHNGGALEPQMILSSDKFLALVSKVLGSRYR